ncbi:MAG: hypothetical protein V9G14_10690 [Cypionkella sp.]
MFCSDRPGLAEAAVTAVLAQIHRPRQNCRADGAAVGIWWT